MSATTSPPASSRHWIRIVVRGMIAFVLVLAASGFIYENISEARDRRFHPMRGRRVNILSTAHSNGDHPALFMHIDCTGPGLPTVGSPTVGSPTVILDAGLGDSFLSWYKVQPEIAKFTRICSYDRAGIGYSDSSPRPRTSRVFVDELHGLLQSAAVPAPYILVGHSMGGFDVRLYASLYRKSVAGMVLVDSSHPEQQKRLPALNDMDAVELREQEFVTFTMPFGIPRLLGLCDNDADVRAVECNFQSAREGLAELEAISESAAQTAPTGPFGDMPLIVLTHDPDVPRPDLPEDLVKPTNDAWQQMQEELAHLSTNGRQVIAKNSGHYIQLDRPDLVVDAVRDVVDQVRQAQPVPHPKR
jgi:pimeloyl-ACP methyl ester carboxylesterase